MDRLLVGGPVPHKHEISQVAFHLATAIAQIMAAAGKGLVKRWNPEARVVSLRREIAPEAEAEFGDDLPMDERQPTEVGGPIASLGDVVQAAAIQWDDVEPGSRAARGRPRDELGVQGIADDSHPSGRDEPPQDVSSSTSCVPTLT